MDLEEFAEGVTFEQRMKGGTVPYRDRGRACQVEDSKY